MLDYNLDGQISDEVFSKKNNDCKNKPVIKEVLEDIVFDTIKKEIFAGKRIDGIVTGIYIKIIESQQGVSKEMNTLEKEIEKLTK